MNKRTIHKQSFEINDTVGLILPKGSEILSCQLQHGTPCIWYLCDPSAELEGRVLRIIGTGHPIINNELKFIDTIQMVNGSLVFHVFELLKVWDDQNMEDLK